MGVDDQGDRPKGPTDYTYDGSDAVKLDDHDRSKNSPHKLNGYQLTINPDGSWPGMAQASGGYVTHTKDMRDVAKWLREQASALKRVPADLVVSAGSVNF